jgi:hypothetical protein
LRNIGYRRSCYGLTTQQDSSSVVRPESKPSTAGCLTIAKKNQSNQQQGGRGFTFKITKKEN